MSWLSTFRKQFLISSLSVLLFVISATLIATPAHADAKKATVVSVQSLINHPDNYGSSFRCGTGDYKPLTQNFDSCQIKNNQFMTVKVSKKVSGIPQESIYYQVTAHNSNSSYICVDQGAIERGYADTLEEIILDNYEKLADVCTTVNGKGDNKTKALFTVTEKDDGPYIRFENTGKEWGAYTGKFPYESGDVKVDFSKVPFQP